MEELQAAYPELDIPKKVEGWKKDHPGADIEELRSYLTVGEGLPTRSAPRKMYVLRTTHICNHKCVHCFNENEKKEQANQNLLTTEELFKIIDEQSGDAESIIITGGEPSTRKDLFEILQYVRSKGKTNTIQSNGMGFADPEYAKKLTPLIETFTLPIHSSDPEIFDAVARCKGAFNTTIKAFKNLKDSGIRVITQTVMNQLSYRTLENTFDLIQSIYPGINMTMTFPHPISEAYTTKVTPRFSEVKPYVHKALRKYAYLQYSHYLPRCVLYPYQDLVLYNLDKNDVDTNPKPGIEFLEGEWRTVDYETTSQYRIKSKVCSQCRFDNICHGVWKEYGALYPELDLVPIEGEKE